MKLCCKYAIECVINVRAAFVNFMFCSVYVYMQFLKMSFKLLFCI